MYRMISLFSSNVYRKIHSSCWIKSGLSVHYFDVNQVVSNFLILFSCFLRFIFICKFTSG